MQLSDFWCDTPSMLSVFECIHLECAGVDLLLNTCGFLLYFLLCYSSLSLSSNETHTHISDDELFRTLRDSFFLLLAADLLIRCGVLEANDSNEANDSLLAFPARLNDDPTQSFHTHLHCFLWFIFLFRWSISLMCRLHRNEHDVMDHKIKLNSSKFHTGLFN